MDEIQSQVSQLDGGIRRRSTAEADRVYFEGIYNLLPGKMVNPDLGLSISVSFPEQTDPWDDVDVQVSRSGFDVLIDVKLPLSVALALRHMLCVSGCMDRTIWDYLCNIMTVEKERSARAHQLDEFADCVNPLLSQIGINYVRVGKGDWQLFIDGKSDLQAKARYAYDLAISGESGLGHEGISTNIFGISIEIEVLDLRRCLSTSGYYLPLALDGNYFVLRYAYQGESFFAILPNNQARVWQVYLRLLVGLQIEEPMDATPQEEIIDAMKDFYQSGKSVEVLKLEDGSLILLVPNGINLSTENEGNRYFFHNKYQEMQARISAEYGWQVSGEVSTYTIQDLGLKIKGKMRTTILVTKIPLFVPSKISDSKEA